MSIGKTYRRMNKALRLAQSGEAGSVLAAAKEILATRIQHSHALASPSAVREYLRLLLHNREHEVFVVVLLDAQNRLLTTEELFRGTLTQTSVYPREVVKLALRHNAGAVILAHNHPSGVLEPSQNDLDLTRILRMTLSMIDVRIHDHIIVTRTGAFSMAEAGLV